MRRQLRLHNFLEHKSRFYHRNRCSKLRGLAQPICITEREDNMSIFRIHECQYQGPGIRIEYSRSYLHDRFTWQLVVTREASAYDLENNHYLEHLGDEVWSTVVEINNCPFCGMKLRDEQLSDIDFAHFDSSGWSVETCHGTTD